MRITHHDHEVYVTFRVRRGRRCIPSIEALLANIQWEDPETGVTHGWCTLVGFAVLGVVMHVGIFVGMYVFEGVEPTWLSVGLLAFVLVLPMMMPLLWGLSKTKIVTRPRYRHQAHELRLSPGGIRLDGRPSEVWLAGYRMVTAEGVLYEVAEDRDALRQLTALLAQAAPAQRERLGGQDNVPEPLRDMLRGTSAEHS